MLGILNRQEAPQHGAPTSPGVAKNFTRTRYNDNISRDI